jgi:hypothetical protein
MATLKRKMQRVEDSRLGTGDIVFIRAQVAAGASGEQDVILVDVDGRPPQRQWAYRDMLWKYVITEFEHQEIERRNGVERRSKIFDPENPALSRHDATYREGGDRRKSWPR